MKFRVSFHTLLCFEKLMAVGAGYLHSNWPDRRECLHPGSGAGVLPSETVKTQKISINGAEEPCYHT